MQFISIFFLVKIRMHSLCVSQENAIMEKYATQIKRASVSRQQLEKIKVGDFIEDEFGKSGKVCEIERINFNNELHYYFHLGKSGTILVII